MHGSIHLPAVSATRPSAATVAPPCRASAPPHLLGTAPRLFTCPSAPLVHRWHQRCPRNSPGSWHDSSEWPRNCRRVCRVTRVHASERFRTSNSHPGLGPLRSLQGQVETGVWQHLCQCRNFWEPGDDRPLGPGRQVVSKKAWWAGQPHFSCNHLLRCTQKQSVEC
jgi:hypothetical protein